MKTKLSGILTLLLAFVVQFTFAQDRTITGTVSDDTGPLPGVSVLLQGTETGTETDFDGNFSIGAPTGGTLQFSFVGMTSVTRTIGNTNVINVTMVTADNTLEEVVITSFGRKVEARATTFAAQQMDGDDFLKVKEVNLSNALAGRISGVQVTSSSGGVGASSRVVLRGAASITGDNEPLYVIDGVPVDNGNAGSNSGAFGGRDLPNGIVDLNPEDIESLNVLKGPAAAALYGVRASNGVIEIVTKKGKKSERLGVTFSSNIDFSNPLILPTYQDSYGQGGNADYFQFIDGTNGDGGVDESWGPPLDAGLEFVQWDSYKVDGAPLPWVSQPNNIRDFYDTGIRTTNNVSFSGGGEDITYRLSVSDMSETGMIPFTDFNRTTISGTSSYTMGEKFTTSVNFNYTKSSSGNLPIVGYDNENPIQQFLWSGRNVNFNDLKDWRSLPLAAEGTAAAGTPLNWNTVFQNNPYWVLETNTNTFDKNRVFGNIGLDYNISDHVRIYGKIGVDHWDQHTTSRQAQGSNNAPFGSYQEDVRSRTEINADLFIKYTTDFSGSDFHFDISVGGNQMTRRYDQLIVTAPQLQLDGLYDLNNLRAGVNYNVNDYRSEQEINSVMFFGSVNWKDMVFIDFTGRNDWASILPPEDNSFFYPSITGSVIVTDFWDADKWFMKVRGGWSQVGGIGALGPYQLLPTYALSSEPFGGTTVGFLPGTLNNPTIKPETTTGYEFGADFRFWRQRIRFNVTYYDQTGTDLVVPVQIPASSGYDQAIANVGEMNNKGYEITLSAALVQTDDWNLDLGINYAKNTNTLVSLGGDLEALVLGGQWNMTLEARPGEAYGSIVGNAWERSPSGDIVYNNGLPVIAPGTEVLGNIQPDWTGGINATLTWKNLSLYTLVDAKIGGDIHSMTTTWGNFAGVLSGTLVGRESGIVGEGVMLDDSGNFVPNTVVRSAESFNKAFYDNSIVESAVFDASYVKLRQMALTFTLPKKIYTNSILTNVNFSVVGSNLAILYKNAPHIDPETAFGNGNGQQGMEFGQIPPARTIGFNVRINL